MTRRRKPHVATTTEGTIETVRQLGGTSTPITVADAMGCSVSSARRHLDSAVERGVLVRDEHDGEGHALTAPHWRYGLAADEPPEFTARDLGGGLTVFEKRVCDGG